MKLMFYEENYSFLAMKKTQGLYKVPTKSHSDLVSNTGVSIAPHSGNLQSLHAT